jgi:hypothetical protein
VFRTLLLTTALVACCPQCSSQPGRRHDLLLQREFVVDVQIDHL